MNKMPINQEKNRKNENTVSVKRNKAKYDKTKYTCRYVLKVLRAYLKGKNSQIF